MSRRYGASGLGRPTLRFGGGTSIRGTRGKRRLGDCSGPARISDQSVAASSAAIVSDRDGKRRRRVERRESDPRGSGRGLSGKAAGDGPIASFDSSKCWNPAPARDPERRVSYFRWPGRQPPNSTVGATHRSRVDRRPDGLEVSCTDLQRREEGLW